MRFVVKKVREKVFQNGKDYEAVLGVMHQRITGATAFKVRLLYIIDFVRVQKQFRASRRPSCGWNR